MSEKKTLNPYAAWLEFVQRHVDLLESAKGIPTDPGVQSSPAPSATPAGRPLRVAICSPHPDDECVIAALPLRLRAELGAKITNLAITFGSKVSQRERRLRELKPACRVLGFDLTIPQEPFGFESVSLQTRNEQPGKWAAMVQALSKVFERLDPEVVVAPHAEDWHPAHIGTHYLAVDALADFLSRTQRAPATLIETATWHEHLQPNLMVGVAPENIAILITALAEHVGEVSRNPYHLRFPSRLIENARRGSETVGGAGCASPDFPFAELYRVAFVGATGRVEPRSGGVTIGPADKIDFAALQKSFQP